MVFDLEVLLLDDALLDLLDLFAAELEDGAAVDADHVVVVLDLERALVAPLAVGEVVSFDDAGILEEAEAAVDRGHADGLTLPHETLVELLGGEVAALVEGRADHLAALAGHLQAFRAEEFLEGRERLVERGIVHGRE